MIKSSVGNIKGEERLETPVQLFLHGDASWEHLATTHSITDPAYFNCLLFSVRWHFKFCSLTAKGINTAFDSYVDPGLFLFSSTFQCPSKKTGQLFLCTPTDRQISTLRDTLWLLGASETTHRGIQQESVREENVLLSSDFSFQPILKVRALFKRRDCAQPLVSYIVTAGCFSDLTYPEKAVRSGP